MSYSVHLKTDLRRNTYPGLFIALEGIDGSGKSSQMEPLRAFFEAQGKTVHVARWPRRDEGLVAELTKGFLSGQKKIPKPAFQYLLTADYIIYSEKVIIPALKDGKVVLSDRCHFWSAVAYGLFDNNESYDMSMAESILVAHGVLTKTYQFIIPDITFYLDVPAEIAIQRLASEQHKEVYEKKEVLEKVCQGYGWLVEKFPDEFKRVNAEKSIEEVTDEVISHIKKYKVVR